MRDLLSRKLLGRVLSFDEETFIADVKPLLALAEYKYDEYQRFHPGMKFTESFATWLDQFDQADRKVAFEFIRDKLIFISRREMMHLVKISYPDYILPKILQRVANEAKIPYYLRGKLMNSSEFKKHISRSLFLGLTDGAHTDWFRRSNPQLNNKQIRMSYEITEERAEEMKEYLEQSPLENTKCFRNLVLLNDFAGSGTSFIREGKQALKGKLARIAFALEDGVLQNLFNLDETQIQLVLYIASQRAISHIQNLASRLGGPWAKSFEITAILELDKQAEVELGGSMKPLIEKYYDPRVYDRHIGVGGSDDARLGYADCGLTLVLYHNTPNNSIYLLWGYEDLDYTGLFPRIGRYREGSGYE